MNIITIIITQTITRTIVTIMEEAEEGEEVESIVEEGDNNSNIMNLATIKGLSIKKT